MTTPDQVLQSLGEARRICLADAKIYPQVIPGIVGVVGAQSSLELRRWGADFLAETFASPVLSAEEKQKLCLAALDTLRSYLNRKEEKGEDEDASVVKSAVQCATSIYPLVFRHTVTNASDSETWGKMAGIKSSILRRMDTAPAGVRICCIKFVARVVQVQTPGVIADPMRPDHNEISLALVPRDHPIVPPTNLEAESSGLLDRLLGVLQDNLTDALVVTATLNALSTLVQRRPSISPKILMTVLNFNPFKLASAHMTGKDKIVIRSMTRTTMSFLLNVLKRNPSHAQAGRLQQRTEQLRQVLTEVFAVTGPGKRKEPDEPTDGLDDAKRRRIDAEAANGTTPQQQSYQQPTYPPLPPGPVSFAQLFMLSRDPSAASFHVDPIPQHIVIQLIPPLLASIDRKRFDDAISAVRSRLLQLASQPPASALDAARAVTGGDEDEDYDPLTGFPGHDQVMNGLDQMAPEGGDQDVATMAFQLPPAPPMTEHQRAEYGKLALKRVFDTLAGLDREARTRGGKKADAEKGFNKLAADGGWQDREGWITVITRLATRAAFGLGEEADSDVKEENDDQMAVARKDGAFSLTNGIRQALVNYVLDDFRRRIDVAIAWLNEEWYSDRLALQHRQPNNPPTATTPVSELPNYLTWSLRTLDALLPFLDTKDGRHLIRFLSEIPQLSPEHLARVKKIADDPERVQVATQALLYLIMLRPPIRQAAIDVAEEMWRENEYAKAATAKILGKWRPAVLEEGKAEVKGEA